MTIASAFEHAEICRQSRGLSTLFRVIAIAMAASLVASRLVWPLLNLGERAGGGAPWRGVVQYVGVSLIEALPAVLLLLGVLAAQRVFARMSRGAIFSADNANDIGSMGDNVLWAAIATVLIVPNMSAWVRGEGGFHFDGHDWAFLLGVLGAAIALMGRVLGLANRIKAENEEIV